MGGPWDDYKAENSEEIGPWSEFGHADVTRDNSVTKGASFLRGGAQGLSMGFADEITGGLESFLTDKDYRTARDESRAAYHAAQEANPGTYGGGQVVGTIAPLLIPGVGEVAAGKLVAQGALQGVGESEAEDVGGWAKDAAKGAAIQAAFLGAGKVAAPALKGAGRLASKGISKVAPAFDEVSGFAGANALGFTKGIRKKLRMSGADTRALGREMVDKGIITHGADTADMIARTEALKKTAGGNIGTIMESLDSARISSPNAGRMADSLALKMRELEGIEAAKPILRQYQTALKDIRKFKRNPSYARLQELKNTYKNIAFPKGAPTEAKPGMVDMYHAIKDELNQSVDEGVKRLGRPDVSAIYQTSKRDYGSAKKALVGLRERESLEGNRWVKPTDFVAGAGIGIGTGSLPVTAAALVGKRGLEKYGPQATAVAARKLAPTAAKIMAMVQNTPEKLGRFAPAIKNAMKRGPAAVTSTHFILMQRDPTYRQLMLNEEDSDGGRLE